MARGKKNEELDASGLEQSGQRLSNQMSDAKESIQDIVKGLKELAGSSMVAGEGFQSFLQSSRDLTRSLTQNKNAVNKVAKGEMDINSAQKSQQQHTQKSINFYRQAQDMGKHVLKNNKKLTQEEKKSVNEAVKGLRTKALESNRQFSAGVRQAKSQNSLWARSVDTMSKGMGKITSGNVTKGLKNYGKNVKSSALAPLKLVDKATLGIGSSLFKIAKGPFAIIGSILSTIVKMILDVNNEVAMLGRKFQVSGQEAANMRQHFQNIAADAGILGVEYGEIMAASISLNSALGTTAQYISGDILEGMARLEHRTKLSAEAALGFGMAALAAGKTTDQLADSAAEGALQLERELGVHLDITKAMEMTGKVAGQVRSQFFQNYELMGKTVARATTLGTTIQEVANQSKGMLNFHSSIEKEMKAELFLGKQLNLEQARLASLTGDYNTYLDEITKNAGDYLDFTRMNVMQQNALADALGMSADQLEQMLFNQMDLNALKGKATARELEDIKLAQEQLSLQEAFAAAMKKFRAIIINLAADMEDWTIPFLDIKIRDLTTVGEDTLSKLQVGTDKSVSDGKIVGQAPVLNDFTIKTHPKDTLVMAGGTSLGSNSNNNVSGMTESQAHELIRVSKTNRSFSYDGFAAVKEAGHYGTKFS